MRISAPAERPKGDVGAEIDVHPPGGDHRLCLVAVEVAVAETAVGRRRRSQPTAFSPSLFEIYGTRLPSLTAIAPPD